MHLWRRESRLPSRWLERWTVYVAPFSGFTSFHLLTARALCFIASELHQDDLTRQLAIRAAIDTHKDSRACLSASQQQQQQCLSRLKSHAPIMPSHPTLRFPALHSSSSSTSAPTATISRSSSATVERMVLPSKSSSLFSTAATTQPSTRRHPMMQMTLPLDVDDDLDVPINPLASPQSAPAHDATSDASTTHRATDAKVPKKRVFSAPSLPRSFSKSAADKIPSLSRSSSASASASATASRFVSRMAPMLRRVVSGNNNNSNSATTTAAPERTETAPVSAPVPLQHLLSPDTNDHSNFLDSDDETRDSLLFMMQVPLERRKSHIPLMSLSHTED